MRQKIIIGSATIIIIILVILLFKGKNNANKKLQEQKVANEKLQRLYDSSNILVSFYRIDKDTLQKRYTKDSIKFINLQKSYEQIIRKSNQKTNNIGNVPHDSNVNILSGILNKGIPKTDSR